MGNTAKYLRVIAATAVVITILIIAYTMSVASNGNRSFNVNQVKQAADQNPHQNPTDDPVPEDLFPTTLPGLGMLRVQSSAGPAAIDAVSSLHGSNIKVKTAYVVSYQSLENSEMTIWYSEAQNEQDAQSLFQAMDAKMPGNKTFANYQSVTIAGKQYKSVTGMGQQHYYWLTGKRVIWIAIGGAKDSAAVLKEVASLYKS